MVPSDYAYLGVLGMEVDVITLADIFVFEQDGIGKDGAVLGGLKPTGLIPAL